MMATTFEVMPVDVFEGGGGHIVLCQEWPSLADGEQYMRVMLNKRDAVALCERIIAVAGRSDLEGTA
jgi:hypothetical protein